MPRSNFLDTNVWMALLWERHVHFDKARQWFDHADEDLLFCRFAQMAVLRLLTTKSVMREDTRSMAGAWKAWDQLAADSRVSFISEPATLEDEFRTRSSLPSPSPKVWADAYLLAFASAARVGLVTFDRSLRSRGADLLVL